MIDYFSDSPYYNSVTNDDQFLYIFYTSSNNYPQVLIKVKLDFFAGLNYSGTNQTGCWYIGPICIQFCNASYSDGFVPIVKPMMLIPNLITETFFNHKSFLGFLKLIDRKIVYIYRIIKLKWKEIHNTKLLIIILTYIIRWCNPKLIS